MPRGDEIEYKTVQNRRTYNMRSVTTQFMQRHLYLPAQQYKRSLVITILMQASLSASGHMKSFSSPQPLASDVAQEARESSGWHLAQGFTKERLLLPLLLRPLFEWFRYDPTEMSDGLRILVAAASLAI